MKRLFTKVYQITAVIAFFIVVALSAHAQDVRNTIASNAKASATATDNSGHVFVVEPVGAVGQNTKAQIVRYTYNADGSIASHNTIYPVSPATSTILYSNADATQYPVGLAVTSNGDVYVVSTYDYSPNDGTSFNYGAIYRLVYTSGTDSYALTGSPFATGTANVGAYTSLAVDKNNNLFATEYNATGFSGNQCFELVRFKASGGVPQAANKIQLYNQLYINGFNGGYTNLTGLICDAGNNVYVADAWDNAPGVNDGAHVYKCAYTTATDSYAAAAVFTTGQYTSALGADPTGDVFAVNVGAATTYQTASLVEYKGGSTSLSQTSTVYAGLGEDGTFFPDCIAAVSSSDIFVTDGSEGSSIDGSFVELIGAPGTQASGVTFSGTTENAATITWTIGNGSSRAVFMAQASSGNATPANSTNYTANPNFQSGAQIGSSGWYCVYNGTGSSVSVTGLTASKPYTVMVVEYDGDKTTGDQDYDINTAASNPNTFTTPAAPALTASGGSDSYSVGGTAATVDAGITVTAGQTNLSSATVSVSTNYSTGDALNFTNQNGITGSLTGSTLTLSGSTTVANYQAALRSVTFSSTSGSASTRTISFTVNDGTSGSNTVTKNITVTNSTTISSLTAVSGTTTNAASVQYTATFAASVSGLSTADFTLNNTGVSGASVSGVSGSGTSWTVTVNTGSGSGTIQLAMNSSSGVTPSVSNATSGSPFAGATYTIDKTAPTVSSITATTPSNANPTNATSVTYTVTFSEAVTGVDASDFALTTSGTSGSVTGVSGSGSTYTVTVSSISGTGTLRLDLNSSGTGIVDVAGNAISGGFTGGNVYNIDQTAPTVSSIAATTPSNTNPTNATSVTYTVTFSEAVTGVDATDFALTTSGTSGTVSGVSGSGTTYTVTVSSITGTGTLRLDLNSSGTGITDAAGNAVSGGFTSGSVYTIDNTAPTISIGSPSLSITNTGSVSYTVTYADADFNSSTLGSGDITLNKTNTANAGSIVVTGSGTTRTVTLSGITGDGTLGISIGSGTATDLAGNSAPASSASTTFTVDNTAPTISIGSPSLSITNTGSVSYTITYGDANFNSSTLGSGDITLNKTNTANAGSVVVTGSGTTRTVTLSGITGDGTLGISIGSGTATDLAGNSAPASSASTTFTVDNTAPTVTSIAASSPLNNKPTNATTLTYNVNFSEPVTGVDASDFTLTTSGTSGSVTNVSGSGANYTVTVGSVTGNGTLRLDLNNSGTGIADAAGNAISGGFTSGDVYTIDNTAPTVNSIAATTPSNANPINATSVSYTVTFSEAVTGVGTTSFTATRTNTVASTGIVVTPVSSSVYTVTVNGISGDGTLRLDLNSSNNGVLDLAGNPVSGGFTGGDVYTIDNTAPTLTSLVYLSNNTNFNFAKTGDVVTLTFGTSEAVQAPTVSIAGHSLTATNTGGNNYSASYTMTSGDTEGRIPFALTVTDPAGNSGNYTDVGAGDNITFDMTPPTIAVSAPSAPSIGNNGTGTVSYTVTYADANFGSSTLGTGNITLNTTGTANGTVGVTGSGTSYTVTISNISGLGSLGISIGAGTATDKAGNSAAASGASATFNVLASDAVLAKFSISNGILTPGFSPGTFTYTDAIGNLTSGIWVIPITDDPKATVTVDGNPAISGVRTSTIPMSVGANTLTVVVTAQDGATTQTYTVTVNRPLPNIAALSSLALSPATTLKVTTGPGDYNYTAAVTNGTTSIQVLPTAQDNLATITVNSSPVASGSLSQSIPLNVGANTITTVVTAEDGVAKKTYIITVNRAADLIATLSNLAVSAGTLGPVFSSSTTSYGDVVPYTTASVKLTPTTTDPNATVTVNGQAVASGALSQSITLNVGSNTVATVVTAQNGVNKVTYNTVITRTAPATNAALASITTTPTTTLVSTTGSGYLNFNANVANGTTSIQVTPTATAATATITVNGSAVASGTLSQVIPLNIGANTITTVLTAQDGTTTKKVIINVTRAASSNTALANLTVNTGTLAPAFTAATNNYSVSLPNTVNQIGITPTTADATATITVGGAPATSGSQALISLALGLNTIPVTVTAQNGAKHTYNVNVTRVPSADAALASITLAPSATLNGATGAGYYNYTASVGFNTASIQVTPVTTDATAKVTVNGSAVASGSLSQSIPLNVGANTITAVVTAQDGTTTRTAIITVTRAGSAVSSLANLAISAGTLSPAFATGTLIYTASVAYPNASVTLTPTTTDPNATVTINGSPAATPVALSVGTNKIVAVVTAQNGTATSTYTTYVTRAQPSTNALYTSIVLSPASTLVATTGTGDLNYTSAVDNSEASVQVVPTAKDATATITVNGQAVTSGSPSQAIALNVGSNTITTVITAQDGVTSKSAIITVTRAMPSANTLYNPISVTKPLDNVTLEDGITVHQAVSPNGDGINDYLTIDGITSYPDNNLMIVDRNGVMVYQTKGYDNSSKLFDGHSNINGKMQLPGTYFYSLDYTAANGENKHKTGFIILKY